MADPVKLDEHGHILSHVFPDGSMAGVMDRFGSHGVGGRLVWCRDGNPQNGYDRVWWYESVEDAVEGLQGWDYPDELSPPYIIRDCFTHPVEDSE